MSTDPNISQLERSLLSSLYGTAQKYLTREGGAVETASKGVMPTVVQALGKDVVHSKYPNEIEHYACAIELINSEGKTVRFFSFPLMPSELNIIKPTNTIVEKTMAGVIVHKNSTFVPFDIRLSGHFGRKFRRNGLKIHNANAPASSESVSDSFGSEKVDVVSSPIVIHSDNQFSSAYKTGYGSTKILERLLDKSTELDSYNKSYSLIFYNLSFNQSFVVELVNHSYRLAKDLNAIWQYNVNFKAVAPSSAVHRLMNSNGEEGKITKISNHNKLAHKILGESSKAAKLLASAQSYTQKSEMLLMLEKYGKSRALGALSTQQKSAITIAQMLAIDPKSYNNIIVNYSKKFLTERW